MNAIRTRAHHVSVMSVDESDDEYWRESSKESSVQVEYDNGTVKKEEDLDAIKLSTELLLSSSPPPLGVPIVSPNKAGLLTIQRPWPVKAYTCIYCGKVNERRKACRWHVVVIGCNPGIYDNV